MSFEELGQSQLTGISQPLLVTGDINSRPFNYGVGKGAILGLLKSIVNLLLILMGASSGLGQAVSRVCA